MQHHSYSVTLRLWVTYTPAGGRPRKHGFYGLHLPQLNHANAAAAVITARATRPPVAENAS